MRKFWPMAGAIFSVMVVIILGAAPAHAQATRTWVSGVGDDANPCSRTAPCKTFAGAISKTAPSGEINVLDPGGFGAVTITKSITIRSDHVEAGVLVSGTNGIIVNNTTSGTTINVVLEGIDFEGLGSGLNGVNIIGSGQSRVTIQNCSIRNFTQNGVNVAGPVGTRVLILDSVITGNAGGLNVQGAGVRNIGIALRTIFDNNPNFGMQVSPPSGLFMSGSKFLGSAVSINATGGADVTSYGDNALQGTGSPTTTPGLK